MKAATAIRKFMSKPGINPEMHYPPVSVAEIKELKFACEPKEWKDLGRQACEDLGEYFEE